MFNHLEYDADTLKREYLRDRARRADTAVPQNYLPNGDVSQTPPLVWRRPAEKLFANWLAILAARQTRPLGSGPRPVRGMTIANGALSLRSALCVLLNYPRVSELTWTFNPWNAAATRRGGRGWRRQ